MFYIFLHVQTYGSRRRSRRRRCERRRRTRGRRRRRKQRRKRRRRSVILKTRARGIRLDEGRVAQDSWAQPGTAGRAGRNAFYANSSMDLDILSV